MEIKELLNEEIEDQLDELGGLDLGSDTYKVAVDGVTKLLDRKIEIDKLEAEKNNKLEARKEENEFKCKTLDAENKDRLIKNGLTALSIVTGLGLTVWGTYKTFKFEEEGTITTSMGRGFITRLLPKK